MPRRISQKVGRERGTENSRHIQKDYVYIKKAVPLRTLGERFQTRRSPYMFGCQCGSFPKSGDSHITQML